MLQRVGQLVEDGAALLEARGRVLVHRAQRAGQHTASMLAIGLVAVAGVGTLVAALIVALVEPLGTAAALAVGGGGLLALAVAAGVYLNRRGPDEEEQKLLLQAAVARDTLRKTWKPPETESKSPFDVKAVLQNLTKNPAAIALTVGALVAALANAKRVTRLGRVIALTGMASTLAGSIREIVQLVERVRESHAKGNGAIRSDRSRAPRNVSAVTPRGSTAGP